LAAPAAVRTISPKKLLYLLAWKIKYNSKQLSLGQRRLKEGGYSSRVEEKEYVEREGLRSFQYV
jgi:hypothetical protein